MAEVNLDNLYTSTCNGIEEFIISLRSLIVDSAEGSRAYLSIFVSSILTRFCDPAGSAYNSTASPYLHLLSSMPNASHIVNRCTLHPGPIYVFIFAAMVCLSCSTFYHLFNAHSEKVNAMTSRLDYAGTSLLICGSYYPVIYYVYFCHIGEAYTDLIVLFLTGITVSAVLVFAVSLTDSFQLPKYRALRGFTFLALGLLGAIPCIHLAVFM